MPTLKKPPRIIFYRLANADREFKSRERAADIRKQWIDELMHDDASRLVVNMGDMEGLSRGWADELFCEMVRLMGMDWYNERVKIICCAPELRRAINDMLPVSTQ